MIQYVFNIGTFFSLLYYVNNITILQCQINGKEYSFSFPLRTTQITWCKQFLTDELKSCCTIVKVIRYSYYSWFFSCTFVYCTVLLFLCIENVCHAAKFKVHTKLNYYFSLQLNCSDRLVCSQGFPSVTYLSRYITHLHNKDLKWWVSDRCEKRCCSSVKMSLSVSMILAPIVSSLSITL